ncbi:MAG: 2-iminoacetate synthase ThiH [Verrucomicrobiae bacterium]|nr:2-iminoacetate synthase ThiH [Verrucomicrobiae bacterium]
MIQSLRKFQKWIEPCDASSLETMGRQAQAATFRHFGRAMRMFAPVYLSNECVNGCLYCGFSHKNAIPRITLAPDVVEKEARHLLAEGFRNILLVAGEHPQKTSIDYLEKCVKQLRQLDVPSINLEIGPQSTENYRRLTAAGAEGLVIYQETYDRETYRRLHPIGPKQDYEWRLQTPHRAAEAGFRRVGIGALLGLHDWRQEALAMAAHLDELQRKWWQTLFTVSIPRLRPAAGRFTPPSPVSDRDLIQLVCALRLAFPQAGIVLSTREPAPLRDILAQIGVTMMSAGSHTDPGGYTQPAATPTIEPEDHSPEQFAVADNRSAREVTARLRQLGYDPVWKDWDACLN